MPLRARLLLVAALIPAVAPAQSLDLMYHNSGISIGDSRLVNGIRLNFRDEHMRKVNGVKPLAPLSWLTLATAGVDMRPPPVPAAPALRGMIVPVPAESETLGADGSDRCSVKVLVPPADELKPAMT